MAATTSLGIFNLKEFSENYLKLTIMSLELMKQKAIAGCTGHQLAWAFNEVIELNKTVENTKDHCLEYLDVCGCLVLFGNYLASSISPFVDHVPSLEEVAVWYPDWCEKQSLRGRQVIPWKSIREVDDLIVHFNL
jgi:hypothetical protein